MEELVLKIRKRSKWETISIPYKEYKIFTGYADKKGRKIFTGDTFEYTERDGTKHSGEVVFSIEKGAYIHWNTWHPFRADIKFWFEDQKDYIEVFSDEK